MRHLHHATTKTTIQRAASPSEAQRKARRVEKFASSQSRRRRRSLTIQRFTLLLLLLMTAIVVLRFYRTEPPLLLDSKVNQIIVSQKQKQGRQQQHQSASFTHAVDKANKKSEDLRIQDPGESESTRPNEEAEAALAEANRIKPSAIPKDPAAAQFQQELEQKAKQQQEAFCRNWKARLEPEKYPEETKFEELVPSALEEIGSMFHDDQTFWMEVYPSNDIVSEAILGSGTWEKEKVQRVGRWLKDYATQHKIQLSDVVFVDIGANVGVYTMNMADLGVSVVAIEPMPSNLQLLRRSFCRNPKLMERTVLHGIGLTSSMEPNQTCTLYSHNVNVGDGTTHCTSDKVALEVPEDYKIRATIPMLRLDQVLGQLPQHQHIAVLKMDTEGYEGHVVAGGIKLFGAGKIAHIQSEFNPEWIRTRGSNPQEYLRAFLDAGYRVRRDAVDPLTFREEEFLTREQALNESGALNGFNDILLEH